MEMETMGTIAFILWGRRRGFWWRTGWQKGTLSKRELLEAEREHLLQQDVDHEPDIGTSNVRSSFCQVDAHPCATSSGPCRVGRLFFT